MRFSYANVDVQIKIRVLLVDTGSSFAFFRTGIHRFLSEKPRFGIIIPPRIHEGRSIFGEPRLTRSFNIGLPFSPFVRDAFPDESNMKKKKP